MPDGATFARDIAHFLGLCLPITCQETFLPANPLTDRPDTLLKGMISLVVKMASTCLVQLKIYFRIKAEFYMNARIHG